MNVAILGAGNAGCAVACDLTSKGFDVTLIKTSSYRPNANFEYLLENNGEITLLENEQKKTVNLYKVTTDLAELSEVEVVIIYIQTNFHEDVIKAAASYFKDGQVVVINPGYFSTAYMLKYCGDKDLTIVEATSSFIDCRIMEPGLVKAGFRNVRNPLGVYPPEKIDYAKSKIDGFGFNFQYWSTPEVALHNPNLIVHTVGAIMSIPRIEKTNGDYCMYWEVFTPSVWKILEKLDAEKMDVIEHLGYPRVPYVEACKFRNTLDEDVDAKEIFFWYAGMPTRAKGPIVVDSRYISEDVPQGLVMLETLGESLNIPTPICTSLIEIASAALGRDLRAEGRTLERLGKENIDKILAATKR